MLWIREEAASASAAGTVVTEEEQLGHAVEQLWSEPGGFFRF